MHVVPTNTAADAAIINIGHGVFAETICAWLYGQGGAPRDSNTGMITRTGFRVDVKSCANRTLSFGDSIFHQRLDAALAIEHTFAFGNNYLESRLSGIQRVSQRLLHLFNTVSAHRFNPLDASASTGQLNGYRIVAL